MEHKIHKPTELDAFTQFVITWMMWLLHLQKVGLLLTKDCTDLQICKST